MPPATELKSPTEYLDELTRLINELPDGEKLIDAISLVKTGKVKSGKFDELININEAIYNYMQASEEAAQAPVSSAGKTLPQIIAEIPAGKDAEGIKNVLRDSLLLYLNDCYHRKGMETDGEIKPSPLIARVEAAGLSIEDISAYFHNHIRNFGKVPEALGNMVGVGIKILPKEIVEEAVKGIANARFQEEGKIDDTAITMIKWLKDHGHPIEIPQS